MKTVNLKKRASMQILEREGPKECILLPTSHQIRPHSPVTRGLFFKVSQSSSKGLLTLDLLAHSLAFSKPGTKYRDCLCSHYIFSTGHTVGAQQIFPDLSNESSDACGPRQELMLIFVCQCPCWNLLSQPTFSEASHAQHCPT